MIGVLFGTVWLLVPAAELKEIVLFGLTVIEVAVLLLSHPKPFTAVA